jgi:hypothetical protein
MGCSKLSNKLYTLTGEHSLQWPIESALGRCFSSPVFDRAVINCRGSFGFFYSECMAACLFCYLFHALMLDHVAALAILCRRSHLASIPYNIFRMLSPSIRDCPLSIQNGASEGTRSCKNTIVELGLANSLVECFCLQLLQLPYVRLYSKIEAVILSRIKK